MTFTTTDSQLNCSAFRPSHGFIFHTLTGEAVYFTPIDFPKGFAGGPSDLEPSANQSSAQGKANAFPIEMDITTTQLARPA
ncbi:hypothetical protein RRG08_061883 [Elysia crispata]|uniref:Uncharacterized protein n=1 Tax=Elysia crispata TaxID=231223 RepID=A0AAE1CIV0_9GAST|nr:hypothetical protein RRG08_061883 [Elysia crispata]